MDTQTHRPRIPISVAHTAHVTPLISDKLASVHGAWYENDTFFALTALPNAREDFVTTFYLKTSVPVEIYGVVWLCDKPAMVHGKTYVIAFQELGGKILADVAYSISL